MANVIVRRLTGKEIPVRDVGLANDLMHWGYGTSMGALYFSLWRYDAATLERDLSAHLVFGISTAKAFALTRDLSADWGPRAVALAVVGVLLRAPRESPEPQLSRPERRTPRRRGRLRP